LASDIVRFPWRGVLVVIVVGAALLRLVGLGHAPPGLNQDEAANAWNAYCLLQTGKDQAGVPWPIFYTRCLGENRSTLFIYILLPFQALAGLSVWTTRLPSALGGVITVALTYVVGARMFGRTPGLVAAALLTLNPWHLQQSRWGHEAALCPLLVVLPLALMLRADLPFDDGPNRRPSAAWAVLGGAIAGIGCYGYPAVRLFLPIFFALAVLVNGRRWWEHLKTPRGRMAIGTLAIGIAVTFGPLAFKHLTDPEIGKRGRTTQLWEDQDPLGTKITKVLARYPGHFGPDFLFINGDRYEIQSPPGFGQFHWYMAPLMILGLITTVWRLRSSGAARILLVWLVTYPVGDLLGTHFYGSMHALRSLPGLCGLILLGAVGAVEAGAWLWKRSRPVALVSGAIAAVVVMVLNIRFLHYFFGAYNDRPTIYHGYHVDLLQACDWLRPRLDPIDAVFCTTAGMNMPYVVSLVRLGYDPRQWCQDVREIHTIGPWDVYTRYGKVSFMYGQYWLPALNALTQNGRPDRAIFIVRPGQLKLPNPVHRITGPEGTVPLWVFEQTL